MRDSPSAHCLQGGGGVYVSSGTVTIGSSLIYGNTGGSFAPNVYVTDGACMTSSACVNPSLTYMALTARAADHAVRGLKAGNL